MENFGSRTYFAGIDIPFPCSTQADVLCPGKIGGDPTEGFFEGAAFADVLYSSKQVRRIAAFTHRDGKIQPHPHRFAVLAHIAFFPCSCGNFAGQQPLAHLLVGAAVIRMRDIQPGKAAQFLPAVAEDIAELAVRVDKPAVRRHLRQPDGRIVENGSVTPFAGAQPRFRLLAVLQRLAQAVDFARQYFQARLQVFIHMRRITMQSANAARNAARLRRWRTDISMMVAQAFAALMQLMFSSLPFWRTRCGSGKRRGTCEARTHPRPHAGRDQGADDCRTQQALFSGTPVCSSGMSMTVPVIMSHQSNCVCTARTPGTFSDATRSASASCGLATNPLR